MPQGQSPSNHAPLFVSKGYIWYSMNYISKALNALPRLIISLLHYRCCKMLGLGRAAVKRSQTEVAKSHSGRRAVEQQQGSRLLVGVHEQISDRTGGRRVVVGNPVPSVCWARPMRRSRRSNFLANPSDLWLNLVVTARHSLCRLKVAVGLARPGLARPARSSCRT